MGHSICGISIILSFDNNVLLFVFVYYHTYMFVYVKLYLIKVTCVIIIMKH